jgi:predicted adenylyl cyclase CyaB
MPQNLELKARITSMSEALHAVGSLYAHAKGVLHQRDIYYHVPRGRLKLRIINARSAELIYYNRPNKKGRRYSEYYVLPVSDARVTDMLCAAAFGQKLVVQKRRRLYLYKNARIHLDDVRGLGAFIEFEVLVKYGKRQAQTILTFLSEHFKVKRSALRAVSYSDMLLHTKGLKKGKTRTPL